jgi:hypothetical protein
MTRCITGKVIHANRHNAMTAAYAEPHKCLKAYECKTCGKWHLAQDKRGGAGFQRFIDRIREADRQKAGKI